jgi:hypothetical protein
MKIMVNPEETAADDPWLFYREPPHWRWISYTAAAERLSVYRRQLAALEKCSHIAFPSRPSVSEMLVDLAIRLSGRYSVPVDTGLGAVRVAEEAERRGAGLFSESGGELVERDGGYVVVEEDGGADPGRPGWLEIGDKHSRRIAGELERGLGSSQKRDIVLHWRPLDVAGERYLVEWAIRVAAGIVLVPERSSMAATAYWIRPTLVHGTAADLRDLARSLAAAERRWRLFGTRERRFRRLRAAVLWGSDPLDPETEEFYASLGARVVRPATFSRQ